MTTRDQYVENLKQTIDELNAKITEAEAKAKDAQADAKAEVDKQLELLKEQAKPLTDKFEQWKEAGEDKFDEYVQEAKKIKDAFIHSYRYFQSQLK